MWGENVQGRPSRYPGHGRDVADGKDEVLAYLDVMHRDTVAILERLGPADLAAPSLLSRLPDPHCNAMHSTQRSSCP